MARNINPGSIRSLELCKIIIILDSNKICYQGLLALCCKLSSSLKNLRIGNFPLQNRQKWFEEGIDPEIPAVLQANGNLRLIHKAKPNSLWIVVCTFT